MYLITGGAGFIGSHLVRSLNDRGETDILVVDDLTKSAKFANLADCTLADYMHCGEFRDKLLAGQFDAPIEVIFHNGACTDTMERDGRYMMENNFTFSKVLLRYALVRRIPFVYASSASVYGVNRESSEIPGNERPINVYAYSKLVFDQYLRKLLPTIDTPVTGLRYFNVYGPRERFKGRMSSMVYQLYKQLKKTGVGRLFQGTDGYGDGEQRRDFIYVQDVVDVNFFFGEGKGRNGIYNLGTGKSRSFNDIGRTLIDLLGKGELEYIPFNPELAGRYQSFTEADLSELRAAGYSGPFTELEDGISASFREWEKLRASALD